MERVSRKLYQDNGMGYDPLALDDMIKHESLHTIRFGLVKLNQARPPHLKTIKVHGPNNGVHEVHLRQYVSKLVPETLSLTESKGPKPLIDLGLDSLPQPKSRP